MCKQTSVWESTAQVCDWVKHVPAFILWINFYLEGYRISVLHFKNNLCVCVIVYACVHNGEREYECTHAVVHWWGEAEDNLTFCFVLDISPCCLMLGTPG